MAKAKRIKGIDCNGPAATGISLVLTTRFGELCEFRDLALDWSDPEGVHSMRVASRRLRSALRDFAPNLSKQTSPAVQKRLKEIADALGQVRDHDVALIAWEKIKAPDDVAPSLRVFSDARKERREEARKELSLTLDKDRLQEFEKVFVSAVEKSTTNLRQVTYLRMSRRIILNLLKEFETLSAGLFKPFDVDTLHDIRIAAKRLRYALELFQPCWGKEFGSYAKRAARIQSALGELHDCDVWIESLGEQIAEARKQKQDELLNGFVWLMNHFMKLRTKHLHQAFSRWRDWEKEDTSARIHEMLLAADSGGTQL